MIGLDVLYNALNASVLPYVEAIEYVDRMSGGPSELKVSLCNADGRFTTSWRATCGDSISLRWGAARPEPLAISGIGVEHTPRLVIWTAKAIPITTASPAGRGGGTAPPKTGAFVTEKKSWDTLQNASIRGIAQRVCDECGMSLRFSSKKNPKIPQVARYNETGYHLLERLCRRYGLAIRSTASEVQIVARPASSDAPAQTSVELTLDKVLSLQNLDSLPAKSVKSVRRDPRSGEVVRRSIGDGDGAVISLSYDVEDSEIYDEAMLDAQATEMSVYPDERFTAGSLIKTPYGLRVVTEMRYNRTGDSESMVLITRAA